MENKFINNQVPGNPEDQADATNIERDAPTQKVNPRQGPFSEREFKFTVDRKMKPILKLSVLKKNSTPTHS